MCDFYLRNFRKFKDGTVMEFCLCCLAAKLIQLSTMDVSVTMMMKNAVKCDNNCDMQPLVNHHIFERILCFLDTPGSIPV